MSLDEESSKIKLVFPKPLPPLEKKPELNEFGFTISECNALRLAFNRIKRNGRDHANLIAINLFMEHECYLERFRNTDGKFNMEGLMKHPRSVLRCFEFIIENLDNPTAARLLLEDMDILHSKLGIPREEFAIYSYAVKDHVLNELQKKNSIGLESAFEKLAYVVGYTS